MYLKLPVQLTDCTDLVRGHWPLDGKAMHLITCLIPQVGSNIAIRGHKGYFSTCKENIEHHTSHVHTCRYEQLAHRRYRLPLHVMTRSNGGDFPWHCNMPAAKAYSYIYSHGSMKHKAVKRCLTCLKRD